MLRGGAAMDTSSAPSLGAAGEAPALGLAALPTFAALPPALTLKIFLAVPVDSRMRCREVSRAWRDALSAERALWTHLDLSATSGVARVTLPLLAAAARADGGLESVDLSHAHMPRTCPSDFIISLLAVCTANALTLRKLNVIAPSNLVFTFEELCAMLNAAPSLQQLEVGTYFENVLEVFQALRREGVFAPVHLQEVMFVLTGLPPLEDEQLFQLAAACGAHESLQRLVLVDALSGTRAALEAVVEAALAAQLEELDLTDCVNGAFTPALARLLSQSTRLTSLTVCSATTPAHLAADVQEVFGGLVRRYACKPHASPFLSSTGHGIPRHGCCRGAAWCACWPSERGDLDIEL